MSEKLSKVQMARKLPDESDKSEAEKLVKLLGIALEECQWNTRKLVDDAIIDIVDDGNFVTLPYETYGDLWHTARQAREYLKFLDQDMKRMFEQ